MTATPRIFSFTDPGSGARQITTFPDTPPEGATDLIVRIIHFTEIENFGFMAYVLAREIGQEFLAARVIDVAILWEHLVASTNNLLIPGQPLRINDLQIQALIEDADARTEDLVNQINTLARAYAARPEPT